MEKYLQIDGVEMTFETRKGPFVALAGSANPLAGQDVGATSAPALGDVDVDGALDLLSGAFDGTVTLLYGDAGRWFRRTGAANPLDGVLLAGGGVPLFDAALGRADDHFAFIR